MLKFFRKGDEGFTLVELLIVIAIIGVLAAIAIPVFLSQINKADAASIQSDANTVAKYIGAMYAGDETVDNTDYVAATGPITFGTVGNVTTANEVTVTGGADDYCVTVVPGNSTLDLSDAADVAAAVAANPPTAAQSGPGCP